MVQRRSVDGRLAEILTLTSLSNKPVLVRAEIISAVVPTEDDSASIIYFPGGMVTVTETVSVIDAMLFQPPGP